MVSSLHSYIVEYTHWKTLQKNIYFTGVPIEGEANKVFWVVLSYIHTLWSIATGKHFGNYFTGVPIEDEVNEVFWVVSSLHSYIVEFSHWKILQKTVYFTPVPMGKIRSKVFG